MKKILIIGASSCLGANLATYLRQHYLVYGTYAHHVPRIDGVPCFQMVFNDSTPVLGVLTAMKPDVVVYCAGITNDRECEQNSNLAFSVNATFVGHVASVLSRFQSRLIYLSSAKVFSGSKGSYVESDVPDPQDTYGSSKWQAEEILRRYENVFTLRLPTVFALGGLNQVSMLNRLLRQLWRGEKLACISDEQRTFISATDLSHAVGLLIDADLADAGTYHLGSNEVDSYFGFATKLARQFGLSTRLVEPVTGSAFHTVSRRHRHANLSLALGELKRQFGFAPKPLGTSLEHLQQALRTGARMPA